MIKQRKKCKWLNRKKKWKSSTAGEKRSVWIAPESMAMLFIICCYAHIRGVWGVFEISPPLNFILLSLEIYRFFSSISLRQEIVHLSSTSHLICGIWFKNDKKLMLNLFWYLRFEKKIIINSPTPSNSNSDICLLTRKKWARRAETLSTTEWQ